MNDRTVLARRALRAALQLRRNLAIPREVAVNAFDIAEMAGLDVRFLDVASLEGMYLASGEIGVGYATLLNHMTYSLTDFPGRARSPGEDNAKGP